MPAAWVRLEALALRDQLARAEDQFVARHAASRPASAARPDERLAVRRGRGASTRPAGRRRSAARRSASPARSRPRCSRGTPRPPRRRSRVVSEPSRGVRPTSAPSAGASRGSCRPGSRSSRRGVASSRPRTRNRFADVASRQVAVEGQDQGVVGAGRLASSRAWTYSARDVVFTPPAGSTGSRRTRLATRWRPRSSRAAGGRRRTARPGRRSSARDARRAAACRGRRPAPRAP